MVHVPHVTARVCRAELRIGHLDAHIAVRSKAQLASCRARVHSTDSLSALEVSLSKEPSKGSPGLPGKVKTPH
jgi:hypothetical protein